LSFAMRLNVYSTDLEHHQLMDAVLLSPSIPFLVSLFLAQKVINPN
jgi:hypothetical protein